MIMNTKSYKHIIAERSSLKDRALNGGYSLKSIVEAEVNRSSFT